jgi:hypothetical protein
MTKANTTEPMSAHVFAQKMGVHYRTALTWLRDGIVPGAVERETPMGNYWEVPRDALKMTKPKPGPKPRTASGEVWTAHE